MILLVPMAGRGQRFKDAGFATPKPFIEVKGEWMVSWALKGIDLSRVSKIVFFVLAEHNEQFDAARKLKEAYGPRCEVVLVDRVTEGAAATLLLAKAHIDSDEDILSKDSDGYIISNIQKAIDEKTNFDGIVATANLPGERWSFARTNDAGEVAEIAEKKRISEHAIVGMYYFRHGRDFVRYAEAMIAQGRRSGGEFYIAPVFEEMLRAGKKITIAPVTEFSDMGVPQALEQFLQNHA